MKHLLGLLAVLSLISCGGQTARLQADGDSLVFEYATLPSIVEYDGYTVVTLANPWKTGKPLHTYVLVPQESPMPVHLPTGTVIRTPLKRAVVFTTVHSALLMSLGCQDKIAGVADLKYIKIPWIQEQVAQGRIADCGDGMSPVIEIAAATANWRISTFHLWSVPSIWRYHHWRVPSGCASMDCSSAVRKKPTVSLP